MKRTKKDPTHERVRSLAPCLFEPRTPAFQSLCKVKLRFSEGEVEIGKIINVEMEERLKAFAESYNVVKRRRVVAQKKLEREAMLWAAKVNKPEQPEM